MARSERIITPEGILSYPHLFEPQAAFSEGRDPKYSAVIVFEEGADLTAMKKAAIAVAKEAFGKKWEQVLRKVPEDRKTFRDDPELIAEKGYPEGSTYISAKSNRRPGIVSTIPNKEGLPSVIEDPEEMYPGARVKASILFYSFDVDGSKGVAVALNNIQKVGDGDRLDSHVPPEDEFEADPESLASLEDVADEGAQEEEDAVSELI